MTSSRWALTPKRAFAVFFVGVLLLGGIFQWLLLPMTSWHAGNGLMAGSDSVQFFDQASALATRIRTEGWQTWELRHQGQWPASLMAATFVLTGWEHPSAVLPIYAVVYGLTAAALIYLAQSIGVGGRWMWLAVAIMIFPSTVLIWAQPHKDAFVLAGVFLLASSWIAVWRGRLYRRWWFVTGAVLAAIGLMWLPRPYLLDVVMVSLAAAVFIAVIADPDRFGSLLRGGTYIGLVFAAVVGFKAVEKVEKVEKVGWCDTWRPETTIPYVHDKIGLLMCYRHGYIQGYSSEAASMIDHDRQLTNYRELFEYLPRAALLAIVSPVPQWCSLVGKCVTTSPGGQVKRLAAFVEVSVFYVALLGWLGWFSSGYDKKLRSLGIGLFVWAWAIALFYVLTSPNEGTLYRMRYPEIALWWTGGIAGWAWLWRRRGGRKEVSRVS